MPRLTPSKAVFCSVIAALSFAAPNRSSAAANIASDNAADPAYTAGWLTGTNGGTGFAPWSIANANPADMGAIIGSSTANGATPPSAGIDVSGKSFGLYSHVPDFITATRKFTGGSLAVGQHVLIDFDNGPVTGLVSLNLRSGTSDRFQWFVDTGLGTGNYSLEVKQGLSNVGLNTGIPFTADGLHLDFTLTGTDTFALDVTPAAGGSATHFTGTLTGNAGTGLDTIAFVNDDAGLSPTHNTYINNLVVTPEPAALALLLFIPPLLVRRRRAR
jgi:hypothetical protein